MPSISASTYSFRGRESIPQFIAFAESLGVAGIELGTDAHWPDVLSSAEKSAIRDAVSRNGWVLNIDYNMKTATLDNFDEAKVQQGISELKADMSLAEDLGAGSVSVRIGLISSSLPDNVDEVRRRAQTNIADALRESIPLAERAGALLLIENAQLRPLEVLETYDQYNQIVEEIGSDRVKFIFDLAHCHTFTGIQDGIDALGHNVHSVHFHDNHGERGNDEHLEFGKGTIDLAPHADFLRSVPGMITFKGWDGSDEEGSTIRSLDAIRGVLGG